MIIPVQCGGAVLSTSSAICSNKALQKTNQTEPLQLSLLSKVFVIYTAEQEPICNLRYFLLSSP